MKSYELNLLDSRITNLSAGLLGMGESDCMKANKAFLTHVRDYMEELLKLSRADAGISATEEPLTPDELRGMDGEPVWCVDGAGHECWCVVNKENEDCIDNEAGAWIFDFYAMTGDDGLYGLHRQLGWLAYRHKPEGGTT